MAKIKGKRALNKAISAQLSVFGINKAVLDNEYSYIFDSETVTYKITENENEDAWFVEFIKERFGYNIKYPFVLSLLHEVGHHKTYDDLGEMITDFCENEKARIAMDMEEANAEQSKVLEWQYFNLPDEIMATQWAVNYAKAHPRKVAKMWREMQAALMEFYEKNGVTEE